MPKIRRGSGHAATAEIGCHPISAIKWPDPLPEQLSFEPRSLREEKTSRSLPGAMIGPCLRALRSADQGFQSGYCGGLLPADLQPIFRSVAITGRVLFVEEVVTTGGFGQMILPALLTQNRQFAPRFWRSMETKFRREAGSSCWKYTD